MYSPEQTDCSGKLGRQRAVRIRPSSIRVLGFRNVRAHLSPKNSNAPKGQTLVLDCGTRGLTLCVLCPVSLTQGSRVNLTQSPVRSTEIAMPRYRCDRRDSAECRSD